MDEQVFCFDDCSGLGATGVLFISEGALQGRASMMVASRFVLSVVAVGVTVLTASNASAQAALEVKDNGVVHFGEMGDPTKWPLFPPVLSLISPNCFPDSRELFPCYLPCSARRRF